MKYWPMRDGTACISQLMDNISVRFNKIIKALCIIQLLLLLLLQGRGICYSNYSLAQHNIIITVIIKSFIIGCYNLMMPSMHYIYANPKYLMHYYYLWFIALGIF